MMVIRPMLNHNLDNTINKNGNNNSNINNNNNISFLSFITIHDIPILKQRILTRIAKEPLVVTKTDIDGNRFPLFLSI